MWSNLILFFFNLAIFSGPTHVSCSVWSIVYHLFNKSFFRSLFHVLCPFWYILSLYLYFLCSLLLCNLFVLLKKKSFWQIVIVIFLFSSFVVYVNMGVLYLSCFVRASHHLEFTFIRNLYHIKYNVWYLFDGCFNYYNLGTYRLFPFKSHNFGIFLINLNYNFYILDFSCGLCIVDRLLSFLSYLVISKQCCLIRRIASLMYILNIVYDRTPLLILFCLNPMFIITSALWYNPLIIFIFHRRLFRSELTILFV